MKIRNLPYNELNMLEQKIVKKHHISCLEDMKLDNSNLPEEETVEGFWELHREADTEDGEYDGWILKED